MSLSSGYHSGTRTWDPFESCSQTIPQPHSLVICDYSPHRWKTLSPLQSLIFSSPHIPTWLSAPSPLIQPYSFHPPSPAQSVSQTDFPAYLDFFQNTPCTPHLNREWNVLGGHCCLCGFLKSRLLILLRYKNSGQHSPLSSWPLPSHYVCILILECVSFVSHAIWLYH